MSEGTQHPDIATLVEWQANDQTQLRIALLGPPVITWAEEVMTVSRRQVRALLYRLAADLQPIPREQICDLIWPDNSLPKARRNLTHLLTHLRLALPEPDLLELTSEYIALDPARTWSDTVALVKLYAERHKLLQGGPGMDDDIPHSLNILDKVVQSYRGPFLSNFNLNDSQEFDAWVNRERQYYECRYLEILSDLIDYHHHRKDHDRAIAYSKRYLEIDNLAEEVHCKLIELYTVIGDRSAAERQFEECVAILEKELGISPSPKTWAVYQAASGPRPHGLADKSLGRLETPFIGRDTILNAIDQAFNLAVSGRGRVILVSGEEGIGKSRLLRQIATHYHCNGTVLYSACSQGLQNLPYNPIAEAFRPVVEIPTHLLNINPLWLSEAARLLPEIYSRFPQLPAPLPTRPEEAQRRLFEALTQLATSLQSRFRPLVIIIDDLHWSDSTTLEWLIYLSNRLAIDGLGHLLIISAYSSEDAQALDDFRLGLNRLGLLEEYSLAGLDTDEVRQIMSHHLGPHEEQHSLAVKLHQISGGNPYYLLETLQAMIDSHVIPEQLADLSTLPLPKTVRQAIQHRLAPLTSLERKVLEVVAVLNHPVSLELAPKLIDASELEILESLDKLVSHNLLSEFHGVYKSAFELVRLVVYNEIPFGQRRYLHRRCARLVELFHSDEIALLTWHFEQSGEPEKAAEYALLAGEQAIRLLAFSEALDFFSRAIVSLKQQAATLTLPNDISANYRLQILALSQRSNVFRSLGEMQAYQDDLAEEARIATALGDQSALAHIYIHEANAHRWFCRYAQALECAEKTRQLSLTNGNRQLQARALREIALAERAMGNFASAETNLKEALQLFHDLADSSYEVHTLCNLSALYTYTSDYRQAEKLAQEALACCEQAKMPILRRIALGDLGVALAGSGRVDQGRECLLSSLDLAREIGDRSQEIFCLCHLGWLENEVNHPNRALGYLRDGLALAERLDSRAEQARLYAGLANAHLQLDNIRLAKSFAYKSLELAKHHRRCYDQTLAEKILAKIGEKL